jgi:hypothetical protein
MTAGGLGEAAMDSDSNSRPFDATRKNLLFAILAPTMVPDASTRQVDHRINADERLVRKRARLRIPSDLTRGRCAADQWHDLMSIRSQPDDQR